MAARKIDRTALISNPFRVWRTSNNQTLDEAISAVPHIRSVEAWRKWEHGDIPSDESLHALAPLMGFKNAAELLEAIQKWRIKNGIDSENKSA